MGQSREGRGEGRVRRIEGGGIRGGAGQSEREGVRIREHCQGLRRETGRGTQEGGVRRENHQQTRTTAGQRGRRFVQREIQIQKHHGRTGPDPGRDHWPDIRTNLKQNPSFVFPGYQLSYICSTNFGKKLLCYHSILQYSNRTY